VDVTGIEESVLYSAVIRPQRSASRKAVTVIVSVITCGGLLIGVVFLAIGAWPILPFLGIEALLLVGAFHLNQRASSALEAIVLTRSALTVRRVDHWGKQSRVSFPPNWLQVNLELFDEGRSNRLEIRSHGRSMIVASFLLPEERRELASALRRALYRLTDSTPVPKSAG
jgi:uncharacterized membrane protein